MKRTGVKRVGIAKSAPTASVCKGLGLSLALTAALCALCALLVIKGVLPQTALSIAAGVTAAVAAFGGAHLTARQAGKQKLLCALGACAAYLLVLLLGNLLFVEGSPDGALTVAIPALLAGVIAAVLGCGQRAKRHVRRK